MNKKKAIKILQKQIDKLKNVSLNENINWRTQTQTYIELLFGVNSNEAKHFKYRGGYLYNETIRTELNSFLNDCISTITNKGVYKEKKINLLSRIPDWSILPIILALIFVGGLIGKYQRDIEFLRVEKKYETLKDSIKLISTNKASNEITSKTNKK
jgi:hypothetical protein